MKSRGRNNSHSGFGKDLTIREWSELSGCNLRSLQTRISTMGMSIEEALLAPNPRTRKRLPMFESFEIWLDKQQLNLKTEPSNE
ncbi:hypothetical protein [Photobacterium kishitanii]|uniref:hypothetical protein n=1 Tax=Photobacterium kishitanii TaxID=318456 RepID=UPI0011B1D31F|nr:hypothetical protein [Photobacterium kishitanii]